MLKKSVNPIKNVTALIKWFDAVDPSLIIGDYKVIKEKLEELLEKLKEADYSVFMSDNALISIALSLSKGLAELHAVKNQLRLVKDMHKFYPKKDGLFLFVCSVIRTFEAYTDEIHTFRPDKHPVLPILEVLPQVCQALTQLIDASYLPQVSLSSIAKNAVKSINNFVANCPDEYKETAKNVAERPIKEISEWIE